MWTCYWSLDTRGPSINRPNQEFEGRKNAISQSQASRWFWCNHRKGCYQFADYTRFARKLLTALRDAIEADLSPASENEVRTAQRFYKRPLLYSRLCRPLRQASDFTDDSEASIDETPFLQRPVSHLHAKSIYEIQFVCDLWCLQDSFTADSCAHAVPFIEFLQQYIQGPKILLTLAQMRRVTLQWWHDLNWQGLLHFCTICIREILEEWQRVSLIIESPLIIAW